VIDLLVDTLSAYGQIRQRSWGEVVSVELQIEGKTMFSFQIAARSAQLQSSVPAHWANVLLDSLPDLLASKTEAQQTREWYRTEFLNVRMD
jgi:hypothetical protein